MVDLHNLGADLSCAHGINDHRQIAGSKVIAPRVAGAFAWSPKAGMRYLERQYSEAFAINNHGILWVRVPARG